MNERKAGHALGVGGIFFRSPDPGRLGDWYAKHLGFEVEAWGSTRGTSFPPDRLPPTGFTVWSAFAADTDYFGESGQSYMINLVVDDLDLALANVAAGGATVLDCGGQSLRTDQGEKPFLIAGVFTDYGSDRGRITMSRSVYSRYWQDSRADALGVYLSSGDDAETVAAKIRLVTGGKQQVTVYSNKALRDASLATFDRTFTITSVLRMLAVLVAFIGILNALMAMQIERARELAILRANGLTPQQLWRLVVCETGMVGFLAGVLSLPLGIFQALALILVINQRSFGWSMQISIDATILVQALVLSFFAALLAGIYPSWRMARTSPALAMRYE